MPNTSRLTGFSLFHPSWAASLLLSVWLAGGCGGEDKLPPVVLPDASDEDTGVDAGEDAGVDAAEVTDFVLSGPCVADEANLQTFVPKEEDPQAAPSLSASGLSYGLVFAEGAGCADAIVLKQLASNGTVPQARVLLDECAPMRNAVAVPIDNDWLVAWLDGRDTGFQVMTERVDPSATPPTVPPTRTALTASPNVKGALVLALASNEQSALLAWTETNAAGDGASIQVVPLGVDGVASGGVVTLLAEAGQLYTALAIAPIPTGGAVLGYVAGTGQVRSIFLQQLAADGAAIGAPTLLSDAGDPSTTLSIAMKDEATDRGAAVYSVNPAGTRPGVRFQALDALGQPTGQYRVLNGNLERANGIGIVTTVSGYAVAYRAISDFNWDFARIRMSFLNDVGNRTGDGVEDVIEATDFGGAPSLAIALDGRLALSWFDDDEAGNRTLKLLNYPCNR